MLDTIDARELTAQTVMNACQYMVGECSCTVKTQNPGVDLLMSANWSESLGGDTVVIVDSQTELNPLLVEIPAGVSGVSRAADAGQNAGVQTDAQASDLEKEQGLANEPEFDVPLGNAWAMRVALTSVLVVAGIAVIGMGVRLRNR